ncbi:MAG: hypothetical protein A2033_18880 [Bacteroidetes bacterium GWA2_31_9]|nr:MAG: hypothetical protein A2033_18880 [Bacteroidetes bacterium GWA2_31_9]
MTSFLKFQNSRISYKVYGEKNEKTVILLHGYLESIEIWNVFSKELAKTFKVICIDIPGHGKSDILNENQTFEDIADLFFSFSNSLSIEKFYLIGHSMGGYATLAFAKKYPEKLSGFCLFHSTSFADSTEKKLARNKEIDLVKKGKKELICSVNIPNAFAEKNLISFKENVQIAIDIAKNISDIGIIVALEAMKKRADMTDFLSYTNLPFLLILGGLDNYISYENVGLKIKLPINGKLVCLENSGHMGFIEEKEESLKIITQFINLN